MGFSARMLSCDCNFPFQICVDSDREDGSVSPFLLVFSDLALTYFYLFSGLRVECSEL